MAVSTLSAATIARLNKDVCPLFSTSAQADRIAIGTVLDDSITLINTNETDIATNAADIVTNAADIVTNAADIVTNAGDISTNAGNITDNADDITALAVSVKPAAFFGLWAIDGDGAQTNGAGMVGDVSLTEAGAAFCKVELDDGAASTEFSNLALTSALTNATANYQLTADAAAETVNDNTYIGSTVPFCEVAFDLSALATWGADALVWEYSDGVGTWATLTLAWDATDTTANDGKRSWQQVGAISFIPPSDWVSDTIDGQAAYWIRARMDAVQLTQTPVSNSVQHYIVEPNDTFLAPYTGVITGFRLIDGGTTLHTANDVLFIVRNTATGLSTAELTFPQDQRQDNFATLTLAVTAGDPIGILVTQEDGTNEVTNAICEFTITLT